MRYDNLTSRYDRFIIGGGVYGSTFETATDEDELNNNPKYHHWKRGLKYHLDLAVQLHDVKDIYIMEH